MSGDTLTSVREGNDKLSPLEPAAQLLNV